MEQLDKAIRQGLLRQQAGAIHPDADQLNAFLEQALSQPERQQVLLHLSRCSDCREVVALSMPELETVPVAAAQAESSVWRRWLVVRWAAAAAAVIVVAGTVTLYQTTNRPQQVAAIVDGPAYVASQQAKAAPEPAPQAEAPKTEAVATETKASAAAAKREASTNAIAAQPKPAEPMVMADATRKDTVATAKEKVAAPSAKTDATMMAKAAPVAAPPASVAATQSATLKTSAQVVVLDRPVPVEGGMLAGTGAAGAFPTGNGQALRPSAEPPLQTYDQAGGAFTVAEAQPPKRGIVFGGRGTEAAKMARREPAPLGVGMFSTSNVPMPNAPALNRRWMVTSDGQLKRSHAIGEEFHPVHVADGIFFKAVAESGSEVWAGGIGGALYHSTDDGKSWMKLMPSSGDQPLIADVVSIHATQRGAAELLTSNGEHWITVDGGRHWVRRE